MTGERFPLADLELAVAGRRLSLTEVAAVLGVTHRHACRLRRSGLSERQADHLAVALGLPPAFVWPQWAAGAEGSAA